MELTHRFTVPTGIEETWAHFEDIAGLATCFPGAQVTSVDGDTFTGSVKVKLGPIALVYNGSGTFVEKDDEAHRFVVDAKGKDKRGNGTAGAHVTATFTEESPGSTKVEVVTELQITGKPAQFGRGVIQDVSDKLLGQFVDCLQARVGAEPAAAPGEEAAAETAGAEEAPAPTDAIPEEPAAAPAPAAAPRRTPTPPPPVEDDALDLGATVLPILARTYWKQVVGAVLILLVLRRLLRRRG